MKAASAIVGDDPHESTIVERFSPLRNDHPYSPRTPMIHGRHQAVNLSNVARGNR